MPLVHGMRCKWYANTDFEIFFLLKEVACRVILILYSKRKMEGEKKKSKSSTAGLLQKKHWLGLASHYFHPPRTIYRTPLTDGRTRDARLDRLELIDRKRRLDNLTGKSSIQVANCSASGKMTNSTRHLYQAADHDRRPNTRHKVFYIFNQDQPFAPWMLL